MRLDEYWEDFTSSERKLFQKSCRRLLKSTFIVCDKDAENKNVYYFISKRAEVFSLYFSYIGFDIMLDRENKVVMLRNYADVGENGKIQINRVSLKKVESIILCCLWMLYMDRVGSGSLSQTIWITIIDLKFELEKYQMQEAIDKSTMSNALTLFSKFNLIEVHGKVGEEDCRIRLYPSLQFAMDIEEFRRYVEITEKRMLEKSGEVEGDVEDEDADDEKDSD